MAETGWLSPGSVSVVADGDDNWNNTANVYASDNAYTVCQIGKGDVSHTLRLSSFGAGLPAGAVNICMEVAVERKASGSGLSDDLVQWFDGTNRVGDNKASSADWPTSDGVATYGSASDGWNASLTAAMVNSAEAGVDIAVHNILTSRTASIDHVRVRFFYDPPPVQEISVPVSGALECGALLVGVGETGVPISGVSGYGAAVVAVRGCAVPVACGLPVSAGAIRVAGAAAGVGGSCAVTAWGDMVRVVPVGVSGSCSVLAGAVQVSGDPAVVLVPVVCSSVVTAGAVLVTPAVVPVSVSGLCGAGVVRICSVPAGMGCSVVVQAGAAGVRGVAVPVACGLGVSAAGDRVGVAGVPVVVGSGGSLGCVVVRVSGVPVAGSVSASCGVVGVAGVGVPVACSTAVGAVPVWSAAVAVAIAAVTGALVDAEQVLNNRVKYTLSHPVFGSRMYEVVVRVVQSSLNMIDRFRFAAADNAGLAADVEGVVSGEEVSVTLPHGTNLRALKPMIDVSIEASVAPASGVVRDFSVPVVYEVTAETGVSRVFTVRASVTEAVGKSIVRFNVLRALNPLLPVDLVADVTESAVTLVSPNVADVVLGALKPTVQISEGASVVPASTQVRDFRGTVPYRVTAGDGSSAVYSADMYRRADVGAPSVAGQVSVSGGVFTMLGSGTDIWGSSDRFFFVFRSMTGDCWAEVLLESQQATNDWAKAGLMVRSTLLGNSVHAFVGMAPLLDGSNRTLFVSHRLTTGGTSVMPFQGGVEGPPVWLRLEKVGTEIRAYRKTVAGSTWTLVQSVTVPLIGSTAYVGFAVCSHTTGLGECVFRGLRVG